MGISEETLAQLQRNLAQRQAPTPTKRKASQRKPAAAAEAPAPYESWEQCELFKYLRGDPFFNKRCFHPANGEKRDKRTGAKLKRMGVEPGVVDVWVLIPFDRDGQRYCGTAFDMKRTCGGKISPEQRHWLDVAEASGYYLLGDRGEVTGASEAIDALRDLYRNARP